MSAQGAEGGRDGTSEVTPVGEVTPIRGIGAAEVTSTIPPMTGGEPTFVTARAMDGTPSGSTRPGASPSARPSPEASLLESMVRIEARFAGLYERQVRTEDAMAMLMSARPETVTLQAPPTPVHFARAGLGSTLTRGEPDIGYTPRDPRTEGFDSDSSAELERSRAERRDD